MTVIDQVSVRSRSEIITAWYIEAFPLFAAFVQRKGGDLEEAKEVFQEAIVLYYEKQISSDFCPEKTNRAYLLGIAKNRWFKYSAKRNLYEGLSHIDMADEKDPAPITQKLLYYLKLTGEKCMDMLQAFYYEKLDMVQLAKRFGYKSERSATVQKYKCLEKVRDEVKRKSLCYEDFID